MTDSDATHWTVHVNPPAPAGGNRAYAGESSTTYTSVPRDFIHLDCGLWAGSGRNHPPHRNFGIVHGNWAVLCDFRRASNNFTSSQTPIRSGSSWHVPFIQNRTVTEAMFNELQPVNELLQRLAGSNAEVKIIRAMRYIGPFPRSQATLSHPIDVFIPDTHIPVLKGTPPQQGLGSALTVDGPHYGRWHYAAGAPPPRDADGGQVVNGRRSLGVGADDWFHAHNSSEIFEDAGSDLLRFLDRLEAYSGHQVRLVQLGDMIDLWMGFACYFQNRGDGVVRLVPRGPDRSYSGEEFIDYWIDQRATRSRREGLVVNSSDNAEVLRRMAQFGSGGGRQVFFVYGNHDCYFARHTPSSIGVARRDHYHEEGLRVEHGHAGDPYNRDGMARFFSGHRITQATAFYHPWTREYEGRVNDARLVVLMRAAELYIRQTNPFAIYVSGHDHLHGLGRVTADTSVPDNMQRERRDAREQRARSRELTDEQRRSILERVRTDDHHADD